MAKKKTASPASPSLSDLPYIATDLRSLAVPIGELIPDPANVRTHGEGSISAVAASLRVYGQQKPVVVRRDNGVVIAGNGTLEAARSLGWTHLAVNKVDMDGATAAGFAISDNRTAELSEWDKNALDKLMREVSTQNDPRLDEMMAELAAEMEIVPEDHVNSEQGAVDANNERTEEEQEEDADEDGLDLLFKAPYPWFGGKARVAKLVWKRFGKVQGYIEPFYGSGAVFLNRPEPIEGTETINDVDGMVSNFWRAVQAAPDEVAHYADWPVNENDLHARHAWLVKKKDALTAKLEGDPDHFDAKIAGWWCWGLSLWIGSGFCSGNGPWQVAEGDDGSRQLVHLGNAGQGVNRQRVHLANAGRGVNRQLVHLANAGRGVNRQLVHLADAGRGEKAGLGECGLLAWMEALSNRLQRVRVCSGDWKRVCGGNSGDAIHHFFAAGKPCGIFLDPPYAAEADRDPMLYRREDLQVAHAVREWAVAHGDDPRLRIALCGYEGEHQMPASWQCVSWKANGGMAGLGKSDDTQGKQNRFRERVWFSPHCIKP